MTELVHRQPGWFLRVAAASLVLVAAFVLSGCGQREADMSLTYDHLDGSPGMLADHAGEVIFLNFWATWCGPCQQEMPSIQRLYDAFGDDVVFVCVSNESRATVRSFVEKKGYTFPIQTLGSLPGGYDVRGIPSTYIIDRNGKIIEHTVGAREWDSAEVIDLLNSAL